MSVDHVAVTRPASVGAVRSQPVAVRQRGALHAAARASAIGALACALACGAYAAQNLHLLGPIGDGLLGVALIALAVGIVQLVLRVGSWLLVHGLRLAGRLARRPAISDEAWPMRLAFAAGRPLVGSTVAIALVLWVVPDDGLLAMFHSLATFEILIVTGAVVGLLAGLAAWAWSRRPPLRRRRAAAAAALVPALVLGSAVGAWAALPGAGDPIVREDAAALATIPLLDLPDPSEPGPWAVAATTYGSGTATRRPEFGEAADWLTPTVDVSRALPPRDALASGVADWVWGADATELPINGLAWYPTNLDGPLPLVLIVHGNHAALESSDPGYAYLGEHLASHGVIAVSVDENYLNGDAFFDYGGQEIAVRAWVLLRHLEQFREWNAEAGHPLEGRVDLERVALIGHSRGGEAVALATAMAAGDVRVSTLPEVPSGLGIRAVVAIAPSDGMYVAPGSGSVRLTDVDYLVLQGARDGDLPAFSGLATYHRVELTGGGDHLKVALYAGRANHGRFNSVWDVGDAGPLASWMLERGSLLAPAEQQRLAKTAIGAFLARSLLGRTEYDAFFREPRSGRDWLPDDVVETHWESSSTAAIDLGVRDAMTERGVVATGFDTVQARDPTLRDRTPTGDRALYLDWSAPATLEVPVDPAVAAAATRLVVTFAPAPEGAAGDPVIELRDAGGTIAALPLSSVAPLRPALPVRLWKLDLLGERYAPTESLAWATERFPQTYAVDLERFVGAAPDLDTSRIEAVTLRFAGAGSVFVDDVGFDGG